MKLEEKVSELEMSSFNCFIQARHTIELHEVMVQSTDGGREGQEEEEQSC